MTGGKSGAGRRWVPSSAGTLAGVVLLCGGTLLLYVRQFEVTNAYTGIRPMRQLGDPDYWVMLVAWVLSVWALLPRCVHRPSDVFLVIYLVGSALWSAAYWPATGLIGAGGAMVLWALTLLPAAAIVGVRRLLAGYRLPAFPRALRMREAWLVPVVGGLVVLAGLLAYRIGGSAVGFDLELAHERRLSGRSSFSGSPFTSYLLQMSMNGLTPYLAFLGSERRKPFLVVGAFAFAAFGFWMFGMKSAFLNVAMLASLGWLVRRGWLTWFSHVLLGALVLVVAAAVVEREVTGVSLVAEFTIRRAVLVGSMIQVYFVDALMREGGGWAFLQGVNSSGYATIEYFIGAKYFGNELTNANASAFLHQVLVSGLIGYLGVLVGVALLVTSLDLWSAQARRNDGIAIAAIVGILLLEQAFTTALVSSGVLLCFVLAMTFTEGADKPSPEQVPDPR